MLQLRRNRRVSDGLFVDIDANGSIEIEISTSDRAAEVRSLVYRLSKSDARRLAAELRFLATPPPPEPDEG